MSDIESEPPQPSGAFPTVPAHLAGRYALGELVGVGASARVYRAHDQRLDRDVAVKLYPPGVVGPDRTRQERELALLSQLHHENLVELLDAGDEDGRAYLVMQLIEDPTLADRLVLGGPMSPGEVARLGAELGDALAYVHHRGITHRDVKPANVLVSDRAMLADFGIARLVDAARVTQTGYLIGTLAYLAPEQVNGGDVGTPADVYALGLTLLEALTGRREYDGDGPEAAFARLSRTPSVPEGLPVLTDLLRTMTALDSTNRPSASDVARQMRAAIPELGTVPSDISPRPVPAYDSTGHGTRVLPMAVPPAGLASPATPLIDSETRRARQRRLLAGTLGATGVAAAAVALLSLQSTPVGVPVPAMSVPAPLINAPAGAPLAQLPAQAVPPGAGTPEVSRSEYGAGGGASTAAGSTAGDSAPGDTAPGDTAPGDAAAGSTRVKKDSKRSGKHPSESDPGHSSSGSDGGPSGGSSGDASGSSGSSDGGTTDGAGSEGAGSDSGGGSGDGGSSGADGGGSTDGR